jgi:hypothetical protein
VRLDQRWLGYIEDTMFLVAATDSFRVSLFFYRGFMACILAGSDQEIPLLLC